MHSHEPHIVFITSGHSPLSSRLFYRELLGLKKVYKRLTIIAPYDKPEEIREGIHIIGIEKYKSRYNRWSNLSALYKKASQIGADILHCHEPDSLLVCCLLKRKFPAIRVIYDCHEFHPYSFTENYPKPFRDTARKIAEKFENFLASRVDAVITVNQRLVNKFKKHNRSVIELPNYPRLGLFSAKRRKTAAFSSNEVRLIYVGSLSADRGVFRALNLLKILNGTVNIRLILVGKFSSRDEEKKLMETIETFELGDKVNYTGYLPHEETVLQLMDSDIGLCLLGERERYYWSEPIKYFEYSAAGLPVIITDFPATKDLVEKNKNGILVPVESTEEAAAAIAYLIKNKQEAKSMAENGTKAFFEKYNWEAIEHRLLDLYKSLS